MNQPETCADVRNQLALFMYGELSFDEEETVEVHLSSCQECRQALERQQELHAAFDRLEVEPPPSLLRECRVTLQHSLAGQRPAALKAASWWSEFLASFSDFGHFSWTKPVGAMALLAIGFAAARFAPTISTAGNAALMGVAGTTGAHVRNVEMAPGGKIQIVVDETSQKVISGAVGDRQVLAMLFSAARDSADPGVRAETVELLSPQAGSSEVRDVLIAALKHDQNAGVRLKAISGLKLFAKDPAVRKALSEVLLSDANPGVRSQAIDLLTQGLGPTMDLAGDRDLVGALQELMRRESNPYVRERCQTVLASWNASPEIY
jgi:hypothetical protein